MYSKLLSVVFCLSVALSSWAAAPKYIFYFIGDGMGMSPVLTAETYNRTVLGNKNHLTMMQFPVTSVATTWSASGPVTDSAAAGTALSTGSKTKNGMLGMNADTVNVYSVAKQLKEKGYGIAIASTVALNDATPAAFYCHQPNRGMSYEIGKDLANSGYDLFMGAPLRSGKDTDIYSVIEKAGYTVARGPEGYTNNKNKNKLLVLGKNDDIDQVGFTIDSINGDLTLPFITKSCIEFLSKKSPNKFFMMIEGGNIDWANHANDAGAAVKEILNFNEGIKIALDFYKKHPNETLIIVTADHNTGGMSLGARGSKHINFKYFDYQRSSISNFTEYCNAILKSGKNIEWNEMKNILTQKFGLYGAVPVNYVQDSKLYTEFNKTFKSKKGEDVKSLYLTTNEFVSTVFNTLDENTGIGWTTSSHTGDFAPVYVIGVGQEKFKGFNDNTDIPNYIRQLVGIK